jgi:hypothetical protein
MTEFLKDFNYVKTKIQKSRNTNEIMDSKQLIEIFKNKYIGQVSHMDPIYIKYTTDLQNAYQERFRKITGCI